MQPPVYIDNDDALSRLTKRLQRQTAVAVDTESNPLFAYRERLCLLQISTRTRDYLIDPIAGADVAQLASVFADPAIVKVFHDAEFDLLMLRRVHPFELASIFDTRVAAAALGISRVGLASMLEEMFGVELDKRYQRSDWGHRPLSEGQLAYAALDTHYLLAMADRLRARLHEAGEPATLEVAAECRRLATVRAEPKRFDVDEFVRIPGAESLDGRGRRVLRELFAMRHQIAERRDVPAFKVLSNDMLVQLARVRPEEREALRRVQSLSPKLARRYGAAIVETVHRANRMKAIDALPRRPAETDGLSQTDRDVYDDLRAWRKRTAQARPTDASLILSRSAMLALARARRKADTLEGLAATGLLEPWRVHYYGEEIVAILRRRRS